MRIYSLFSLALAVTSSVIITSCATDNLPDRSSVTNNMARVELPVINITSFGTKPSFLNIQKSASTKSLNLIAEGFENVRNDFTETKEFESSESVVLNHLNRYVFPGSLLMGNSIQDLNYKPVFASLNPITVSLSIPAINQNTAITITNPSLSATRAAVYNYLKTADFTQNGQLSYSIEQFSSYDELKVAFGSNVNSRNLFGKNSSSTNVEEGMIARRTGFYVKFYQTSFTLDMDVPNGSLVKDNNFDSEGIEPVYVSSISYGRMGILAIETNEKAEDAKRIINETFNKLFYKKQTNFSQEEKSFIEGADFNLYLVGGDGSTASQSFKGYEAFVNHVSQGTFSKDQPGVPIFCSYSYLKDNSPVKTKFKFDIKRPPLYVKLVKENIRTINTRNGKYTNADLKIYYYKSRSGVPVIADPSISFKIQATKGGNNYFRQSNDYSYPKEFIIKNTSMNIFSNITKTYDVFSSTLDENRISNGTLSATIKYSTINRQGIETYSTWDYKIISDLYNNYIVIE
ncbi:thiol-activated cytolysin family protein [Elizabethkingia anophelis]|uniref:thiol-activated cytolysin family protein n=1 Tax=Elizabethkingia anophelis TaxID=1117645 RepID=UPI00200CD040|nr:thiol-activated cytolysin family protein [Elizabethkingia anophelis]MCL1034957.1 thiol-activated cytolysin family protein [Elizabethkingia anophelis]